MKRYKVLLAFVLVVLAAAIAVVATGVIDIRSSGDPTGPSTPAQPVNPKTDYTDYYNTHTEIALPLLKTDFENVFFTMSKLGDVQFYQIVNGVPQTLEETGSYEVTAVCSSQKLSAMIHCIELGGKTFGCGLFTNQLHPEVLIYDYAFFKVTEMFTSFRDINGVNYAARGAKLLLIDTDSSRFFSNEKIYSEAFVLNTDHSTSLFLSNDQRTVDMDAREREDYKMFTDSILDQHTSSNVLFFSSRYYADFAESGNVDIFTSGGSGTNIDNVRYVIGIDSLYFWKYEGETYFFRAEDAESFTLKAYNAVSGETRSLETFSGSLSEDYLVRGQWILDKHTGALLNVITGQTCTVPFASFSKQFTAGVFEISENGRYCVIAGADAKGKAICGRMELDTGSLRVYTNDIFGGVATAAALNDGTVLLSAAASKNGETYLQLIGADN